jgi:hypothetical protein
MKLLHDYTGRTVRLTDERLKHVLEHPELAQLEEELAIVLRTPDEVRRSKSDAAVELAYRHYVGTMVGDKWLCVVSKYSEDDAFVITAYLTDALKSGEVLWPKK